jgi:hypothetical protein
LAAGRFLPWLERFGWMARLDALMLERVLKHLPRHHAALALNLSAATLADAQALQRVSRCWAAPRTGAAADLRRAVARTGRTGAVHPAPARAGFQPGPAAFRRALQHDRQPGQLGLAYLKIDGGYIRNIDHEQHKRLFIEAINGRRTASTCR